MAGGVGVAGLGVAVGTGLVLPGKQETVDQHCDEQKLCDAEGLEAASEGSTLLVANTMAWAVAITGLGTGALLILTSGAPVAITLLRAPPAGGSSRSVSMIQPFNAKNAENYRSALGVPGALAVRPSSLTSGAAFGLAGSSERRAPPRSCPPSRLG